MMFRYSGRLLPLFAFSVLIWNCSSRREMANNAAMESMGNEAEERMAWEVSRLRDPENGRIPDFIRQKELAWAATQPSDADYVNRRSGPPVTFTNRGPWNVGGRTRAFGIDIANENRLLAGSCSGGMWLSTDRGESWKMTNTMSQLKNATCLVQDKRAGHQQNWYYGSGEAYGASASRNGSYYLGDGLFQSSDSGKSWQSVVSTSAGSAEAFSVNWQLVWNVTMDYSAPDSVTELYAATYNTIFRSANGGKTWAAVRNGSSYFTDVAVSPTGIVYATMSSDGGQKGIWRSEDGIAFTNITPPNFAPKYNRIVIGIDPNDERRVYFLANTPGFGKGTKNFQGELEYNSFWRYTYLRGDGKDTNGLWLNLTPNLPNSGGQFDRWQVQGSYDMVVQVQPGDSNRVFIGGTNLYRSDNAFKDSTHTTFIGGYEEFSALPVINSYPNHHPDQHVIAFSPSNPLIMYSANDGGLFRTDNSKADSVYWEPLNNGYVTSMFFTVALDHASPGNPVVIGGAQDNGSWFVNNTDPKASWVSPRGGDGSYCAISAGRKFYYLSIQNGKMMKATLDAAGTRTAFTRIDPIGLKKPRFINPYALDPNQNKIMYLAGGKYLWRNDDVETLPLNGSWDSISTGWIRWKDSVPTPNSYITAVTPCMYPLNRVYYGTDNRRVYRVDDAQSGTPKPVDITSNGIGVTFPSGASVSCLAADPSDGNKMIVAYSNYNVYSLFYTTDGGSNWQRAGGNLEPTDGTGPSVRWVSILPVSDGKIYLCATSTGLYATTALNGNQTVWVQQGANTIGNSVCDMIDTRVGDGLVAVATHANGIFTARYTSVSQVVSAQEIADIQWPVTLYPNPAKDEVYLKFTTSKMCRAAWEIWDECGRILAEKQNLTLQPGFQNLSIVLPKGKAGLYFVRLQAGNQVRTLPVYRQ
ncbi:MAG: T9SS type A sorting domain-containing protein [Bacteroidetes bacterium]|nr:T9SS type A sorting domain-containing protein [Bacteroidota bacterium]